MKSLKNILSALAFVLAIGATFAFSAPETIVLAHKAGECTTTYPISSSCALQSLAKVCKIDNVNAVDPNASDCETAQVFMRP